MVKSKLVFRSPVVPVQNPETELILDSEDDNVSLLQEKEVDNLGGTSAHQHFLMAAIEHHLHLIVLDSPQCRVSSFQLMCDKNVLLYVLSFYSGTWSHSLCVCF